MLPPTFSKHCCTDCTKGDSNFVHFCKKINKKIKSYIDTKIPFHEEKFSVRFVEISAKNYSFPFLMKNANVRLAS